MLGGFIYKFPKEKQNEKRNRAFASNRLSSTNFRLPLDELMALRKKRLSTTHTTPC